MEIRIPQIITASSKLSLELADRIHLSTRSRLTGTPTALILPAWPAHLDAARQKMLGNLRIASRCPMLSVVMNNSVFEKFEKKHKQRVTATVISLGNGVEHQAHQADVLVFHVDLSGESMTLLFDIREKATNAALRQWVTLGFIPIYCRNNSRDGVGKMVLGKIPADYLELGTHDFATPSLRRFVLCASITDSELMASSLPVSLVRMLVTAPENLPHALGLGSQPIYRDGVLVGHAEAELIVP